ncbi:hypothetical protein ACLOJK_027982 [Asimina triloba]
MHGERARRAGERETGGRKSNTRAPAALSLHRSLLGAPPMPMATTSKPRDRFPTEDERRVADILLRLPKLMEPFRSLSAIRWGRKRRRSSLPTAPSPSCSSERPLLKAEAASPATPLSFSPSDTDDYSGPKISRKRDFRKKSHAELKEEIARLSAERIQLENEYSKRSEHRNELQALNLRLISQLKGSQSQLSLQAFYQPHLRQCRRSLDYLIGNLTAGSFPGNQCPNIINHLLVRPGTADLRAEDSSGGVPYRHEGHQQPSLASTPSGPGLALEENHSMAVGILDLNAPPKETISFDFLHIPVQFKKNKAAIAAEARKKRMEINRGKSSLALKQSRFR